MKTITYRDLMRLANGMRAVTCIGHGLYCANCGTLIEVAEIHFGNIEEPEPHVAWCRPCGTAIFMVLHLVDWKTVLCIPVTGAVPAWMASTPPMRWQPPYADVKGTRESES